MLNTWIGMGRLTRDPELKHTSNGVPVVSFTIAVDRQRNSSGEVETDFIDIVAWRQTAEFISRNFSKGRLIAIEGSLRIREYTDKEGRKRRTSEIAAENVHFCERKKD